MVRASKNSINAFLSQESILSGERSARFQTSPLLRMRKGNLLSLLKTRYWDPGPIGAHAVRQGVAPLVEPEAGHLLRRAVATDAGRLKDRLHVAAEIDFAGSLAAQSAGKDQKGADRSPLEHSASLPIRDGDGKPGARRNGNRRI